MKTATGATFVTNGQLIDGNGAAPVRDGALVIRDGRIAYAGPAAGAPEVPPDAQRIDARGGTVMPGLVEAHFHATYFNIAALEDLDIKYPVEYVSLLASVNTRLAVECGYTALCTPLASVPNEPYDHHVPSTSPPAAPRRAWARASRRRGRSLRSR